MTLLALLASIGLTSIILYSTLFEVPRSWWFSRMPESLHPLAECPQCLGFWAGVAVSVSLMAAGQIPPSFILPVVHGLASSACNVLYGSLTDFLDRTPEPSTYGKENE